MISPAMAAVAELGILAEVSLALEIPDLVFLPSGDPFLLPGEHEERCGNEPNVVDWVGAEVMLEVEAEARISRF